MTKQQSQLYVARLQCSAAESPRGFRSSAQVRLSSRLAIVCQWIEVLTPALYRLERAWVPFIAHYFSNEQLLRSYRQR